MQYQFRIQDPTFRSTVYLFEAIIKAISEAVDCRAIFSFASRNGVEALFLDPTVKDFLRKGKFLLIVGIDAITNRQTLERLQEFEKEHPNLSVKVFWNSSTALFHPKI